MPTAHRAPTRLSTRTLRDEAAQRRLHSRWASSPVRHSAIRHHKFLGALSSPPAPTRRRVATADFRPSTVTPVGGLPSRPRHVLPVTTPARRAVTFRGSVAWPVPGQTLRSILPARYLCKLPPLNDRP